MRQILLAGFVCFVAFAQTGTRITPPTLRDISQRGIARGTTVELTVEGFNLAGAKRILFSDPAVKGRIVRVKELPDLPDVRLGSNGTASTIDLGPLPPRNQVTVEVEVDPEAAVGPVSFRVETPLGTSPEGTLLVEPYYGESPDKEPNDLIEGAFAAYLPSILTGAISKPGDVDHFQIRVKAGTTLAFDNGGMSLGSTLQPVVAILDADGKLLKEYGYGGGRDAAQFAHTFAKDGTYYVRVADYEKSGRATHTYRIKVGEFGLISGVFPLGLQRGRQGDVTFTGVHLGAGKARVTGTPSKEDPNALFLRPETADGAAFQRVRLAVNDEPEVVAAGSKTPQTVTVPVTVNGRLTAAGQGHRFRFSAKKGQALVFDVNARRLGSELDSFVEVVDAKGNRIEQAVVRPVVETFTTLRDHDSAQPGVRITHWNNIHVGDYILMGQEVARVAALPRTPDEDIRFESFMGQRRAFFNSSSEAQANDRAVYKVQMHPAGATLPPNGLPLTRLYAQNDDGGAGWGKDSFLRFTAPADGEYLVNIRDVQGLGGDQYTYRLTVREPRPDFDLAISPANPNVPRGGAIPLAVTAIRSDGFDGPIAVTLENLPAGFTASAGTILPGQNSTVIVLRAAPDAKLDAPVPLLAKGRAGDIVREANPEDSLKLISLAPRADVQMTSPTRIVELSPGGVATVTVKIARNNGFGGRVPVEVLNLPPRTLLPSFGLNGVLLNEDETERTFEIAATPQAEPGEQYIVVGGRVETRSGQQNIFASPEPILLRIKAKTALSMSQR
ncbi:MAG: PPC domain-containing protein [Bryobacteraceae bacterium]